MYVIIIFTAYVMKKDQIIKYCNFLDVHRQFYCSKKVPSNSNYEYCGLLSKLYSECITAYVKTNK